MSNYAALVLFSPLFLSRIFFFYIYYIINCLYAQRARFRPACCCCCSPHSDTPCTSRELAYNQVTRPARDFDAPVNTCTPHFFLNIIMRKWACVKQSTLTLHFLFRKFQFAGIKNEWFFKYLYSIVHVKTFDLWFEL